MHIRTGRSVIRDIDVAARAEDTLRLQARALGLPADALDHRVGERRTRGSCDLTALGAFEGGLLVGFTYGIAAEKPYAWRHSVLARLEEVGHRSWTEDVFYLCELHVLPAFQGRGLGTRLLTGLCARASERRVILTTPDGPTPARRLYRRFGYRDLADTGPADEEPYAIMGAELPLLPAAFRARSAA